MKQSKLILKKTQDFSASDTPDFTVVMIHGIAASSASYDHAFDYFKNDDSLTNYRFVTFDLLGSGESPKDDSLKYDYEEQLEALHAAISELSPHTPIVLVGHSLGTFIVTRYASTYPEDIKRLILISPPIFTKKDFDNPAFWAGIEMFKKAVSAKNPEILKEKAFTSSMDNIVLCRDNYQTLADIKIPTTLIFGTEDRLIASHNIPGILKKNKNIIAIPTLGRHGISKDKYTKIATILKETLNETI